MRTLTATRGSVSVGPGVLELLHALARPQYRRVAPTEAGGVPLAALGLVLAHECALNSRVFGRLGEVRPVEHVPVMPDGEPWRTRNRKSGSSAPATDGAYTQVVDGYVPTLGIAHPRADSVTTESDTELPRRLYKRRRHHPKEHGDHDAEP